jgi:hypothetical protein
VVDAFSRSSFWLLAEFFSDAYILHYRILKHQIFFGGNYADKRGLALARRGSPTLYVLQAFPSPSAWVLH